MRRDALEALDEILISRARADFAASAAALRAIKRERGALDVTAVGDGHQHVFLDDEILDGEFAFGLDDLGAARIAEFFFDVFELGRNDLQQLFFIGEDFLQPRDRFERLLVLQLDLLALQSGQAAQRHVEDRLRLNLRELELIHQAGARRLRVLGGANQLDHRVEVAQRDQQTFQNVDARFGLAQLELRAPRDDPAAMS